MYEELKMTYEEFGDRNANTVLIQAVDANEMKFIEEEVAAIERLSSSSFLLLAAKTEDWFCDLSPWKAPPVFGDRPFGDGAARTLDYILGICPPDRTCYIGGYSLAGLFALWAVHQTDAFSGAAAASPSVWFPGFMDYMKDNRISCGSVYLSLGDREEKTRNPVMASVGRCISEAHDLLVSEGIECTLEYNRGNHFTDPAGRTAAAFAWLLRH